MARDAQRFEIARLVAAGVERTKLTVMEHGWPAARL
jgi:hypothetical protein